MKKSSLIAVLALAVAAVPASAKDHPGHDQGAKAEHAPASPSRQCTPHGRAFVAGGQLAGAALTKNDDGTYSGTMTMTVKRANHHAKATKGTDQTFTLDHARVNLHGQDPAALKPGSRAFVLGKVTSLNQRCDQTGFTATTTIRRADVKAPKADDATAPETEPAQPTS